MPHDLAAPCTSISPDLNRIAIIEYVAEWKDNLLNIYDTSSGKCLVGTVLWGEVPWFAPNGREVWCSEGGSVSGWTIVEDSESDLTRLDPIGPTTESSGGPLAITSWLQSYRRWMGARPQREAIFMAASLLDIA